MKKNKLNSYNTTANDLKFGLTTRNLRIFFFCFIIASVLWMFNIMTYKHTLNAEYNINFEYNKNRYTSLKPLPKKLKVTIKGTGWQLLAKYLGIGKGVIKYQLFNPIDKGEFLLANQILPNIKNSLGNDLEIIEVKTDTVPLNFDRIITKEITVKIDSQQINLEKNTRIDGKIELYPNKLLVKGPSKQILTLPQPYPISLPIQKINKNIEHSFTPSINNPSLKILHGEKIKVKINTIAFLTREKEVPIVKVNFPHNIALRENHIKTEFAFRASDIGKIRLNNFKIMANYATFNSKDSTVQLQLINRPYFVDTDDIVFEKKAKVYEKK